MDPTEATAAVGSIMDGGGGVAGSSQPDTPASAHSIIASDGSGGVGAGATEAAPLRATMAAGVEAPVPIRPASPPKGGPASVRRQPLRRFSPAPGGNGAATRLIAAVATGDMCSNCRRIIQTLFANAGPAYLPDQPDRMLCPTCCTHEEIFGLPWPRRKPLVGPGDASSSQEPALPESGHSSGGASARRTNASGTAFHSGGSPTLAGLSHPTARDASPTAAPTKATASTVPRVPADAALARAAGAAATTTRLLVLLATHGGWRPALVRRSHGTLTHPCAYRADLVRRCGMADGASDRAGPYHGISAAGGGGRGPGALLGRPFLVRRPLTPDWLGP
jgi:hypothetical protein